VFHRCNTSGDTITTVAATAYAPILELDSTYNLLMTHLAPDALRWHEGNRLPPDGHGLGLNADMDWVHGHRYNGEPNINLGRKTV
jgi:hypothetical protein